MSIWIEKERKKKFKITWDVLKAIGKKYDKKKKRNNETNKSEKRDAREMKVEIYEVVKRA